MSSGRRKIEAMDFLASVKTFAPKQDKELECAILSCIIQDPEKYNVFDIVTPEMFMDEGCRAAYKAIKRLYNESGKIDYNDLEADLLSSKDHFLLLLSIAQSKVDSSYFDYYIKILKHRYLKMWYLELVSSFPLIMDSDWQYEEMLEKFEGKLDVLKPLIAEAKYNSFFEDLRKKKASGFVPHKVRRGEEEYYIRQSKFNPEKGYTYIDNVPVQEDKLLEMGFEQVYD